MPPPTKPISDQLPLDLGHRPAMGMDDFLVADGNRDAVAWLDRWPNWPGSALVLHGATGCGKTHLAHVWRAASGATLTTGPALAAADPPGLLAGVRAVAVDDADRLSGAVAEETLLHLINLVAESGCFLLLTGASAPARWPFALPDLTSRLRAMPAVAVGAPDDALLSAVLVKLFADRQLAASAEVVAYVVPRMERSFAAARRLVGALDAASLSRRQAVTVPLARAVLEGIERG